MCSILNQKRARFFIQIFVSWLILQSKLFDWHQVKSQIQRLSRFQFNACEMSWGNAKERYRVAVSSTSDQVSSPHAADLLNIIKHLPHTNLLELNIQWHRNLSLMIGRNWDPIYYRWSPESN
jgi:hypothetical protein